MYFLNRIDLKLLIAIHDMTKNYFFDWIMPFIINLGNGGLIWIVISLLLLTSKKHRKTGIMCLSALLLTALVGEVILKHLFKRPRPFVSIQTIRLLIPKPGSYSFPSGHAGSSFAAAGVLVRQFKKWHIPIYVVASLIAFSRIYLYVHYPFDVLGGIVLGLLCAKVTLVIFRYKKF